MRRRPSAWRNRGFSSFDCWKSILAVLFFVAFSFMPCSEQETMASEYVVKAAFLFHFASFTDWPSTLSGDDPLIFCTIGEDPFRGALDTSVEGKRLGKRLLRVRHFKQPDEVQGCQILFIAAQQEKRATSLLEKLKDSAVLTAGETGRFVEQGGIIAFRSDGEKIGFDINLEAAERARIKISARLLTLAKNVIGKPKRTE